MPRTCFVIMPFSTTHSCTEDEWTSIFENLLKPAVEAAGLDYQCHRSVATRGNIVGRIVQDLNDSYVVIADLTDHNANVFYELGVRHALKNRSIILAQERDDIPFDLRAYAYHVYGWRTDADRKLLTEKLRELLREIDSNPDRPDNPVSDFLQVSTTADVAVSEPTQAITPQQARIAQPLIGPGAEGLDVDQLARQLAKGSVPSAARTVYRLTKPELLRGLGNLVDELNKKEPHGAVQSAGIPALAKPFVTAGDSFIVPIEVFVLASIEERWKDGVLQLFSFAGDLITQSANPKSGRAIRFAVGMPALLALRALVVAGTKALADDAFEFVDEVVNRPIEVEKAGGQFTHLSLLKRQTLFYSEAFLGYANYTVDYLKGLWSTQNDLRHYFESEDNYHFCLSQLLMILVLASAANSESSYDILYPGYKLVPQSQRAMSAFCGRLNSLPSYRDAISKVVLNANGDALKEKWESLAARANSVGREDFPYPWTTVFPSTLQDKAQE